MGPNVRLARSLRVPTKTFCLKRADFKLRIPRPILCFPDFWLLWSCSSTSVHPDSLLHLPCTYGHCCPSSNTTIKVHPPELEDKDCYGNWLTLSNWTGHWSYLSTLLPGDWATVRDWSFTLKLDFHLETGHLCYQDEYRNVACMLHDSCFHAYHCSDITISVYLLHIYAQFFEDLHMCFIIHLNAMLCLNWFTIPYFSKCIWTEQTYSHTQRIVITVLLYYIYYIHDLFIWLLTIWILALIVSICD